ncbi:hypothetical protein HDU79_000196 [Rhizoclosmatium sp. JEL0117]|nr:hypothetical protein HDU79_000196 [Rhizoclosmatium sp. JEL0117]
MNPATEPGPSQYVFNAASNAAQPSNFGLPPPPNQPKPTPKYIICPFGPPIQLRPDGRRKRFHAARDQLVMLEAIFQQNKKPNAKERVEICKRVNMNPRSLQIWFQNRRAKDKKGIAVNIGGDSGDASEDRPNAGSSASSAPDSPPMPIISPAIYYVRLFCQVVFYAGALLSQAIALKW